MTKTEKIQNYVKEVNFWQNYMTFDGCHGNDKISVEDE